MGMNYYHHPSAPCPCCGREYPRVHIGKSSAGWTFSFRGYHPRNGHNPGICSYADWLKELNRGGIIKDEYGREVTLVEFKQLVMDKKGAFLNHAREYPDPDRCWLDPEGHSFTGHTFS